MRVACVQLNSRADVAENVRVALGLVEEAAAAGARLIVLPETWTCKGDHAAIAASAEPLDGPSTSALATLAARLGVFVLAGSIYESVPGEERFANASVLIGPDGSQLAVYRKIHLFDAEVAGTVYRESDELIPGDKLVTAEVDGLPVGLTICYDLRFPELYRALALAGARLLFVPAAFTAASGALHWEVLLRARAIENGCFVLAADQVGEHLPGRACFGHSMIVDPRGTVLAECEDGPGYCVADLDLALVDTVREQLPVLRHRVPVVYGL